MWEATHSISAGSLNGCKLHHTHHTDVWETWKGDACLQQRKCFSLRVPLCASTSRQAHGSGPAAQALEATRACWKNKLQCQNIPQHFSDVPFTKTLESWGIFPTNTPKQNSHLSSIYLLCCNLLLLLNNASEMQSWADHSATRAVLLKCDSAHLTALDQRGSKVWAGLGIASGLSSLSSCICSLLREVPLQTVNLQFTNRLLIFISKFQ